MPDLRGLNDDQLEKQIAGNTGHLHDAAVHERQRRQMERLVTSAVNQLSQPNAWTQWAVWIAIVTMLFAGIAAWPVIHAWFSAHPSVPPSLSTELPIDKK